MDASQDLEGEADVLLKGEGAPSKLDAVESFDILRAKDKGTLRCQGLKSWNFARQFYLWIITLKEAFGAPFLAAIIIVYGISQGYVGTVRSLATNYYWKDVQKLQPATTQAFQAFIGMPWTIKPVYGLITDTFPIAGFQRWPYIAICGVAGACSLWVLSMLSMPSPWLASLLMASVGLCTAFPDVVLDAVMAEQSRNMPTLASDLQSLSWGSLSVGGFLGCLVSGSLVHSFGPRGSFLFISIAPLMLLVAAWALPDARLPKGLKGTEFWAVRRTLILFKQTLQESTIWRPAVYIYLSQGLCPDISEAMFYWFTDPEVGPGFTEQFIGIVSAIGYVAMFAGIAIYNCLFRSSTFRSMFLWPQVAYCAIGLVDLALVSRWNLRVGVPDHAFVVGDAVVGEAIGRLQLIPFMVLSSRLCPPGIEGTVFAFLMSLSNFGATCASWAGAILLRCLGVHRKDYSLLWLAVLLRSLMRLLPLFFLFLLPSGTAQDLKTPVLSSSSLDLPSDPSSQRSSSSLPTHDHQHHQWHEQYDCTGEHLQMLTALQEQELLSM